MLLDRIVDGQKVHMLWKRKNMLFQKKKITGKQEKKCGKQKKYKGKTVELFGGKLWEKSIGKCV